MRGERVKALLAIAAAVAMQGGTATQTTVQPLTLDLTGATIAFMSSSTGGRLRFTTRLVTGVIILTANQATVISQMLQGAGFAAPGGPPFGSQPPTTTPSTSPPSSPNSTTAKG